MKITTALLLFAFSLAAHGQAPRVTCPNADPSAGGCLVSTATHIYAFAGVPRTFAWEPNAQDLPRRAQMVYQVQILTWPAGVNVANLSTPAGQEFIQWTPPRAGVYYVRVRGCANAACGSWNDSRDDSLLNSARGWMITAAVRPPTGGGIE